MLLWGSMYPSVKAAYANFEIDTTYYPNLLLFVGIRFTASGLLLSLFNIVKQKRPPMMNTKKEWLGVLLVGVFAVILNYACTAYGLAVEESSKTALLKQSCMLVFVVVSAFVFKEDKLTAEKGIGALLGLVSIVVLNCNELGISITFGSIVIIMSSLSSATSSVICKKLLKNTDTVALTGYSQLFGGLVLLSAGIVFGGKLTVSGIADVCLFSYIIIATCVSYALWYFVVQRYDLSKLFIIKLCEPVFAAIISAIVFKDNLLQLHYIVAFLSIGIAVLISNMQLKMLFKRKMKPQEKE